jgi:glyoxylase-like metal-dependent hydrolase (beta-lactamase superfamily II)
MRVIPLQRNPSVYSCHSYLILGEWNRIDDLNTLIDPGVDDFVLEEIERLSTGFGKVAVEQVILTHNHFDHAAGVAAVKQRYGARVFAFSPGPEVDELLYHEQFIKVGDDFAEVLHTPGHSSDSICLFIPKEGVLFSGDTQVRIVNPGGVYTAEALVSMEQLADRQVNEIYGGHDAPVLSGAAKIIARTVACMRASTIVAASGECMELQHSE